MCMRHVLLSIVLVWSFIHCFCSCYCAMVQLCEWEPSHTHHLLYSTIRKNGTLSISRCCVNFCVLSLLLLFCRAWSQVRRHWSSDLIDNSEGASTLIERRRGESGKNCFVHIDRDNSLPSFSLDKKRKRNDNCYLCICVTVQMVLCTMRRDEQIVMCVVFLINRIEMVNRE